jgi:RNA polymerase sigma-70 factor (ECF subfamily)
MPEDASSFHTRPSLLLKVRDPGDAGSWRTFVEVYGPLVYAHGRRRGLKHEDAEDVTQRVFANVAKAIRSFEYQAQIGRFRDWLGTVVRHEVFHFLSQQERQVAGCGGEQQIAITEAQSRGEEAVWTEEFQAHVLNVALARSQPHFEPDTWRAFELLWQENRQPLEVAKELGRPIDWVYVAKSRVLKHLWKEVQELAEDAPLG